MAQTRFAERTLPKLQPGDWTDARYPGLVFRVGQKTRTWMHRQPRLADGSRPGAKLGRYPALNLDAALAMYKAENGRLARGQPHSDPEARIKELEAELRALKRSVGKLVTFGDLAQRFLDEYVPKSKVPLTPGVHRRYTRVLERHALPHWKNRDADLVEDFEIDEVVQQIKQGAPFVANLYVKLLKTMYSWGVRKKIVAVNPCAHMSPPVRDTNRSRVLSGDELRAAWWAFDEIGSRHGDALKFLVLTGQRRGEVAGLPWSEIQGDWWCLPADRCKKGRQPNLIFIAPLARGILDQLRPQTERSGYVFRGYRLREERPLSKDHVTKLSKTVSDRLVADGVARTPFTVHDLRRTFATTARSLGAERKVVKQILGHASNTVTDVYDLYGMGPEIQDTLSLWNDHLTDLLGLKRAGG